jgi:uncharacterized protein YcgL (UPF0745 family)
LLWISFRFFPEGAVLPLIRQPAADTFPESRKAFLSSPTFLQKNSGEPEFFMLFMLFALKAIIE